MARTPLSLARLPVPPLRSTALTTDDEDFCTAARSSMRACHSSMLRAVLRKPSRDEFNALLRNILRVLAPDR